MGAREAVLAAARSLEARGRVPWSPAELVAEAHRLGDPGVSDATLKTHVQSRMCADAPDHHAKVYADLRRVGHGLYRLT